jgi:hypothetical protein
MRDPVARPKHHVTGMRTNRIDALSVTLKSHGKGRGTVEKKSGR